VLLLRLGFIPLADTEELRADVDAFAASLSEALGDPVRPLFAPDYKSLLTALEQNIAQIAWVPPIVAARAVRSGKVLPAAVAVRGGASAYTSALFARSGSPIAKLADLDGLRAAWVDHDSAAGYVVIRAALEAAGVDLQRTFKEETFLRTHEAVARAVIERRADVGATYLTYQTGTRSIARAGWREVAGDDQFRIVAEAGPIPADFFGVHKSLAGARLELLQSSLVDARQNHAKSLASKLFQTDGFIRPMAEHLASLEGMLARLEPAQPPPLR
jgi:phosphonate transport system substrate-binding protein